jgi:hypothetical protein
MNASGGLFQHFDLTPRPPSLIARRSLGKGETFLLDVSAQADIWRATPRSRQLQFDGGLACP